MDYSNFAPSHPLYNDDRMSQLFCMKIEGGNHRIAGFCALKAKCYALLVFPDPIQLKYERENGINPGFEMSEDCTHGITKRLKGVPTSATGSLTFLEYYNVLKTEMTIMANYKKLVSTDHVIHRVNQQKSALTSLDDKRFYLSCNMHSLAYENHLIDGGANECDCLEIG